MVTKKYSESGCGVSESNFNIIKKGSVPTESMVSTLEQITASNTVVAPNSAASNPAVTSHSTVPTSRPLPSYMPTSPHPHQLNPGPTHPDGVLPLRVVRKFARRARDYARAYRDPKTTSEFEMIEKMKKLQKTHRNIVDLERVFLRSGS